MTSYKHIKSDAIGLHTSGNFYVIVLSDSRFIDIYPNFRTSNFKLEFSDIQALNQYWKKIL